LEGVAGSENYAGVTTAFAVSNNPLGTVDEVAPLPPHQELTLCL